MSETRELRDRLESLQTQAREARERLAEELDAETLDLAYQAEFEELEARRTQLEVRRDELASELRTAEAHLAGEMNGQLLEFFKTTTPVNADWASGLGIVLGAAVVALIGNALGESASAPHLIAAAIVALFVSIALVARTAWLGSRRRA